MKITELNSPDINSPFVESLLVTPEILEEQEKALQELKEKEEAKKIAKEMFGLVRKPLVKIKLPGRNDKCPCGSGKKYKNCCMEADAQILDKIYDKGRKI